MRSIPDFLPFSIDVCQFFNSAVIAHDLVKVDQMAGETGAVEDAFNQMMFWCCTIKVDIENSKGQYIEKDKQEATKDGSESTKIQHGI